MGLPCHESIPLLRRSRAVVCRGHHGCGTDTTSAAQYGHENGQDAYSPQVRAADIAIERDSIAAQPRGSDFPRPVLLPARCQPVGCRAPHVRVV